VVRQRRYLQVSSAELPGVRPNISDVIRTFLDISVPPNPELRLVDDLGFDSLSLVALAATLEDSYGLRVPDSDLDRFEFFGTVGNVGRYVGLRLAAGDDGGA
jgi:acyl carrier protein